MCGISTQKRVEFIQPGASIAPMKLVLLTCLLCLPLLAVESAPEEKDDLDELVEISEDMSTMAEALYDDRHDESVQLTGKVIDAKMENLKREIDATVFRYTTLKGFHPSRRERLLLRLAGYVPDEPGGDKDVKYAAGKTSVEKLTGEKLYRQRAAELTEAQIVQTRYSDMPLRWKSRISAYFASLAAEEAKWTNWSPPKNKK